MTDYIKREAAVQADPIRKELAQQADAASKAVQQAELPIARSIERVRTMLSLFDLAQEKAWVFEDGDENTDETLEKFTTRDSECWASTWSNATSETRDLLVLACEHLVERKQEMERCERLRQEAWDKVFERARKLREEWVEDTSKEDN